jgi:hypothetical protein
MAKIVIGSDSLAPRIASMIRAFAGHEIVTSVSIPQGNKYTPHQSTREMERRMKQLARHKQRR